MRRLRPVLLSVLALLLAAPSAGAATTAGSSAAEHARTLVSWRETVVDADQNFRGLAAVSSREAWVTGESLTDGPGRVFHTRDGGRTWQDVSPPDTAGLSFRDVEVTRGAVHVLAIGPGAASRIYRTTDGGARWTEVFRNPDPAAFYDCMAFYPGGRDGLAVSDPVDGKIRVLSTRDAGRTWRVLPNAGMPPSDGEFGFAASGDCLVTAGPSAFLVTGGTRSRVLRSDDRGLTWSATGSGIPAGDAAGGFAGAFAGPRHGIVVGGDFADPTDGTDAAAYTRDGRTWSGGVDLTHVGEDVAYVWGTHLAVATGDYRGSTGTSLTFDGGASWWRISDQGYHTVKCVSGACWGAGGAGRVGHS